MSLKIVLLFLVAFSKNAFGYFPLSDGQLKKVADCSSDLKSIGDLSEGLARQRLIIALQSAVRTDDLKLFKCVIEKVSDSTIASKMLLQTAQYGNQKMVKFLVEHADANVNILDKVGETPLFRAVYQGHSRTVKYLLEKGANANTVAKYMEEGMEEGMEETPIFEAIRGCHNRRYTICPKYVRNIIGKLKDYNADINIKNKEGYSPLALATHYGQTKVVRYLIRKAGADVNSNNTYDETPLYIAAHNGNLKLVRTLVEVGHANIENVTTKHNVETTPLHAAAKEGHKEIVEYLVEKCPNCVNITNRFGYTALSIAAHDGNLELLEILVEDGHANIENDTTIGTTPLQVAAMKGHNKVVKYLVQKCPNCVNIKNKFGCTALYFAARNGNLELLKFLVEKGHANIENVKTKHINGTTPLHVAAMKGHNQVVKYLVEKCPNCVNIKNKFGYTALYFAARNGNLELLKFLVEKGHADIENVKTNHINGTTPLHVAAMKGHNQVVEYLVEKCPNCVNIKNRNGDTAESMAKNYCKDTRITLICMVEEDLKEKRTIEEGNAASAV